MNATKTGPDWKLRLEFVGENPNTKSGRSRKFWQAEVWGNVFVRRWGRIGTDGQVKRETFGSRAQAEAAATKVASEKQAKGYVLEVDIISLIGSLG